VVVMVVVVCKILWRWWVICVCAIYIHKIHFPSITHCTLEAIHDSILVQMQFFFNEGQPGKLLIFLFHAWVQVRSTVTCNSCLIRGKYKLLFLLDYWADRSNNPLTLGKNQKPDLLQKLIVTELIRKYLYSYGTRSSITAGTFFQPASSSPRRRKLLAFKSSLTDTHCSIT
jgi:hypothetical protein